MHKDCRHTYIFPISWKIQVNHSGLFITDAKMTDMDIYMYVTCMKFIQVSWNLGQPDQETSMTGCRNSIWVSIDGTIFSM